MKFSNISRAALAALLVTAGFASPVFAQGKSKGEKKPEKTKVVVATSNGAVVVPAKDVKKVIKADEKHDKAVAKSVRKRVTPSQAVIVTREVLVTNGYQIVNVVPTGTTQVIYFRRGNRGNGRGLGPVEKLYVIPSGDVVRFTSVPDPLLATILRRLGMQL